MLFILNFGKQDVFIRFSVFIVSHFQGIDFKLWNVSGLFSCMTRESRETLTLKRWISGIHDNASLGAQTFWISRNGKKSSLAIIKALKLWKVPIYSFLCEFDIGDYQSDFQEPYFFNKIGLHHGYFSVSFGKVFAALLGNCIWRLKSV